MKKYMSDFVGVCCLKLIKNSMVQIELAEMNSKQLNRPNSKYR